MRRGAGPGGLSLIAIAVATLAWTAPSPASASPASLANSWPMHQFDAAQTGYSPFDYAINRANVSSLRLRSTLTLANPFTADAPVIANGILYVTGYGLQAQENLYAFPAMCGTSCQPLWTASVGYNSQPRVAAGAGMIFVGSSTPSTTQPAGRLWAFPADCGTGNAVCAPAWTYDFPTAYPLDAAPTVSGNQVFVPAGFSPSYGPAFLYAFDVHCGQDGQRCAPQWKAPLSVASLSSVAVANGVVYVTDYGNLRAFAVDCGTGGATCNPLWTAGTGIVGPPTVDDGKVFVTGGGFVWAYAAAGCRKSQCSPLWMGGGSSDGSSAVAAAQGLVYLVSDNGRLYALPEDCHAFNSKGLCRAAWIAELHEGHIFAHFATPAVVDDVVFVTWTTYSTAWAAAFPTTCDVDNVPCPPLWKGTVGYYDLLGPAIVGNDVFFGGGPQSGPGQVFRFATSD